MTKITEEQLRAVSSRGKVIVSASAGSGKTFVMIERLVSLVLEGGHVRDMLAVTFTVKAATQLKERLRLALLKRIGETSGAVRARLTAELTDLPLMEVGTIHAFCGRLIRTYFYLAGVDPTFRVLPSDSPEGKSLSARAMEEVFEKAYAEGSAEFRSLLSVYFRKKKDARLRSVVSSLYGAARETADPRLTLSRAGGGERFEEACGYLAETYRRRALFFIEKLEENGAWFAEHNPRALSVSADLMRALEPIADAEGLFGQTACAAEPPVIASMPRMTKAEGEELARLRFLSGVSKAVKALYRELSSYAPRETEEARYLDAESRARALAGLALAYDEAYSRLKRENNALDYNDLEQFALRVLEDETVRAEVRARYRYVCVDEYQDVNPVQERILSAVSGDEVFLVGDGKQAIYGFRGSNSEFFARKEREFPVSLCLARNFRSSEAVIEAVNRVFAPLLGENYALAAGGDRYGAHRGAVLFHLLPGAEKREAKPRGVYSVLRCEDAETYDAYAEEVASLVSRELGSRWYDAEAGCEKQVKAGDIAVLARKNSGDAERISRALVRRGIPVSSPSRVNVCDFFEARLLLDWLSYLDNAEQDVPLVTAMLSAIGGFTERDLARIRLAFPDVYAFREACAKYAERGDGLAVRLVNFFRCAERLRAAAQALPAADTAMRLLSMGLETQIAAKEDGALRLARVRRLLRDAEGVSVHAFLARLKAAEYRVDYAETGGEDAVKVLTMHASKGLEFPVVFLASMDTLFHGADRDEVLFTERFLAAPKSYDVARKTVYDTVLRRASEAVQEEEELVGERNLLYVGMTRAKYRLHLVFSGKEQALSPRFARRFSDFIDFDACASYFVPWEEGETPPAQAEERVAAENDGAEVLAVYNRPYAFGSSPAVPAKTSATALMRTERVASGAAQPSAGRGHTTEEGLAYHAFLQHVTFGKDPEEERARMLACGELTAEQDALLDGEKLRAVLSLPALRALAGKRLYREQKFLALLPACEISETDADDLVVVQGAIDLLAEENGAYTVVDYKFSSHDDARIRADYARQISVYRKAVARATGTEESAVKACILNIDLCCEIPM